MLSQDNQYLCPACNLFEQHGKLNKGHFHYFSLSFDKSGDKLIVVIQNGALVKFAKSLYFFES